MKIRDRIVEFRRVKASELIPNERNWRTHPKEQGDAMRGILSEIGYADALLARSTEEGLKLIDGHLRAETTPDHEVPVLILDLDEAEADKLLLSLDPLAGMAGADPERVAALHKMVETNSEALQKMYDSVAKSAGALEPPDLEEDGGEHIEIADQLREKWQTEKGQIWVAGDHTIGCGDSRDAGFVMTVLEDERATLVFTDPPYGVGIGKKNRMLNEHQRSGRNLRDIEDDELPPEKLKAELMKVFVIVKEIVMEDDATVFVTAPQGGELGMMMLAMMADAGLPVRHVLIWVKNQATFSMGRLDYDYQHEPIFLTWGKKHKRPMLGKHRTSCWQIDRPRASAEHPTMKPVELYANAYLNNSDPGDIVFDPYCGSGTALDAAQQVGRRGRGIEKDPAYVAVTLERLASRGLEPEQVT